MLVLSKKIQMRHWIRWIVDLGFLHTREDHRTRFSSQVFVPQSILRSHTWDSRGSRQASPLELRLTDQKNGRCEKLMRRLVYDATHQRDCITVSVPCHGSFFQTLLADIRSHNFDNFGLPLALGIFRGRIVHRQPRFLSRGFSSSLRLSPPLHCEMNMFKSSPMQSTIQFNNLNSFCWKSIGPLISLMDLAAIRYGSNI